VFASEHSLLTGEHAVYPAKSGGAGQFLPSLGTTGAGLALRATIHFYEELLEYLGCP
jgi:hypothetical protein